jgi:hypothetical protein
MRQDKWVPKTAEERLDRLESLDAIRQLPHRYALAVDSRNVEDLVELFPEDVQVGRDKFGRTALRAWWMQTLSNMADSIHFVGNHVIDLLSPETAQGVVYCRDELEKGKEWHVGVIQYWDDYVRQGGRWYFKRRKLHRWYMVDALTRPQHGAGVNADKNVLRTDQLPDVWPSWAKYWQELGRPPR